MFQTRRKQILSIFLSAVLALGVLSACGQTPATSATEERLLEKGYYAVYDTDDNLVGYLQVNRSAFTRMDAEGHITQVYDLDYDAKNDVYLLDEKEAFTIRERGSGLRMTTKDDERFRLKSVKESDIPTPGSPQTAAPSKAPESATSVPVTEVPTLPEPTTPEPTTPEPTTPEPTTPEPTTESGPYGAERVYEIAQPSTVNITAIVSESYYYQGTGFFDDDHGTVITNYHVIDGSISGYITTSDGQEYDILEVIGYDADLDIAILSTAMKNSIPLEKRATAVRTGETVYALGSSLGLAGTFSDGIVSTARREDGAGHVYIQHTAAISHGNSGGPLLDAYGRVIGINCAYFENGQNLNLAIPIAELNRVSRTVHRTLASLYEETYGKTPEPGGSDSDEWYLTHMAGQDDRYMVMALPPEIYENIILEEDETAVSATLETDDYIIYLATSIDYTSYSDEEFLKELSTLVKMFDEELDSYDYSFAPMEMMTVTLNNTDWYLLYTSASAEGITMELECLLYHDEKCVMYCAIISALMDGADETDLYNTVRGMITSLEIETSP